MRYTLGNVSLNAATHFSNNKSVTSSLQIESQRLLAAPNKTIPICTCDRRRRDNWQETLPGVRRFKQLVSHHAIPFATKFLGKLHKKLPSVF